MKTLISLVFFLIFFVGANVLNTLEIDYFAFFYFILLLAACGWIVLYAKSKQAYKKRKWEYLIVFLIFSVLFYRMQIGMLLDSIRSAAILFATPFIYLLVSSETETRNDYMIKERIMKLLIVFYIVECGLAIVEYILKERIFLWVDLIFESHSSNFQSLDSFRSIALHGAPLTNALLVTILNAFFITAPIKNKYKLFLWSIGVLAVLAFNARMAVIVNVFLLAFYLLRLLASKNVSSKNKFFVYFFVTLFSFFIFYLIINYGWGDRLFKSELFDQYSGQIRMDVFSIFDYVSFQELLKGHSMKEFENLQGLAGLFIIENFWVCEIILFGLVFVVFLVFFYAKLMGPYLKEYNWQNRIVLCFSFLFLASTNNSLFTQYIPLLLFLTCLNIFRIQTVNMFLPQNMVE